MRRYHLLLGLFLSAPAALATADVAAQSAPAKSGSLDLKQLAKDLESRDPQRMMAALQAVASAVERKDEQAKQAAPLVEGLLRRGASSEICERALDVAGLLGDESLTAAVAPYVRHRITGVRHAAARALAQTGGPQAQKILRRALRSRDAALRSIAAKGLGQLGAKQALPELMTLLERGMVEAAVPVAQLCEPAACQALLAKSPSLPFEVLTESCDALVFRAAGELPDEVKIQAVDTVQASKNAAAGSYLQSLQKRWPKDGSANVKQAIDRAVEATREAEGE